MAATVGSNVSVMQRADVAIVGTGLAGCLTMLALARSKWGSDRTITLIDVGRHPLDRRAWSYWARSPVVPGVTEMVFDRFLVADGAGTHMVVLRDQRYRRVRGEELWSRLTREVNARPRWSLLRGRVTGILDRQRDSLLQIGLSGGAPADRSSARMTVAADFVLDSRAFLLAVPRRPTLSFRGVHTAGTDAGVTLMDLNVPQRGAVRFRYAVPEPDGTLLTEWTSFNPHGGVAHDLAHDLDDYLGGPASPPSEAATYPLVRRGSRRLGPRRLAIGRGAGVLRSSTGYAVTAIARDAAAIAGSFERWGHPFAVSAPPRFDRWLDSVFLDVLSRDPGAIRRTYVDLFRRVPGDDVLDFLDGGAGAAATARIIASMPMAPFAVAALRRA